jgi:hypothetical protein
MRERIFAAADRAGGAPETLTLVYNLPIRVDDGAKPAADTVTGPVEAIVEQLVGFTRLGFTGFNVQASGPDRDEQVERIANEVIPAVRSSTLRQARLPE